MNQISSNLSKYNNGKNKFTALTNQKNLIATNLQSIATQLVKLGSQIKNSETKGKFVIENPFPDAIEVEESKWNKIYGLVIELIALINYTSEEIKVFLAELDKKVNNKKVNKQFVPPETDSLKTFLGQNFVPNYTGENSITRMLFGIKKAMEESRQINNKSRDIKAASATPEN